MDDNTNDTRTNTVESSPASDESLEAFGRVTRSLCRNRPDVPLEELEPYRDQFVAWDPEVTRVIASSPNEEYMQDLIRAAGYDPALCMVEFIS